VTSDRSKATEDDHRVVPFRPRNAPSGTGRGWPWPHVSKPAVGSKPTVPPVRGLAKYEGGEVEDNYRHRMIVNFTALAFTAALAAAGVWLAIQIAELRKNQDCYLSGRRNCAPIDVKVLER
jgi:hypothetical protein